ncbi:MAG TPA: hypothetical protein VGC79_32925, partial [Polyangiaceae bacterium]
DRQIPILPSLPAPFGKPLPGTLAIVPSDAGGEAVHVRLTARRFNGDTGEHESRVVREAIVKVPTDRVAMLHMPLRWLCDGEVEPAEGDSFRSSCPNETDTCVAGTCKSADVDANLLPDYLPSEVFGGGTPLGKGSTCLDVQTCFAQTPVLQPDEECTVPLPAGATPLPVGVNPLPGIAGPEMLNVALVLPPESDGHCLDDPDKGPGKGICFMPLDSDPNEGFVKEGDHIRLPKAACQRKNVVGVAVSLKCSTKDLSIPVCGPWNGWAAQSGPDGSGGTSGMVAAGGSTAGADSSGGTSSGGTSSAGTSGLGSGGMGGRLSFGGFGGFVVTAGAPNAGYGGDVPAAGTGGDGGEGGDSPCNDATGCMCIGFDDVAAHVPLQLPALPPASLP